MYRLDEASQTELPPRLIRILEELKTSLLNRYQHLALILHYLMLEVGFILQPTTPSVDDIDPSTPCKQLITSSGGNICFRYLTYNNYEATSILQIIPCGANITIVGTFGGQPQASYSMDEISIEKYTTNINSSCFPTRFRNLKNLSRILKNNIGLPLLSHAKNALDLPVGTESFSVLDNDSILAVLKHIKSAQSLGRLSKCSKRLYEIAQDNSLWKNLTKDDFPLDFKTILESNRQNSQILWKDQYKRIFRIKKNINLRSNLTFTQLPPFLQPLPEQPTVPRIPFPGPFWPIFDPPF